MGHILMLLLNTEKRAVTFRFRHAARLNLVKYKGSHPEKNQCFEKANLLFLFRQTV